MLSDAAQRLWVFAQSAEPGRKELAPADGVALLSALAGLVILGIGMVLLVWLGARVTRRYMADEPKPADPSGSNPDDWSKKPLDQS